MLNGRTQLSESISSAAVSQRLGELISGLGSQPIEVIDSWLQALEKSPAPDMSRRLIASVLTALQSSEEDAPESWTSLMAQHFNKTAQDQENKSPLDSEPDVLSPAVGLIRDDFTSTSAAIALAGLAEFPLTRQETKPLVAAISDGALDEASFKNADPDAWIGIFRLLDQALEKYYNNDNLTVSTRILTGYLSGTQGEDPPAPLITVLDRCIRLDATESTAAVAGLITSWTTGATAGTVTPEATIKPLIDRADDLSDTSYTQLSSALVEGASPQADPDLRRASIDALAGLQATTRGQEILSAAITAQASQIGYNSSVLAETREALEAIFSLPFSPKPSDAQTVINTYQSLASYYPAETVKGLCAIPLPASHTDAVLEVLANQAGHFTKDDWSRLIQQLRNRAFTMPPNLAVGFRQALVAEGRGNQAQREAVVDIAARLPLQQAINIALQIPDGAQVVTQALSDPTDAQTAVAAYIDSLTEQSLHGEPQAAQVLNAIRDASGAHFTDVIDDIVIDQLRADRDLDTTTWIELLKACTEPTLIAKIDQRVTQAVGDGSSSSVHHLQHLSEGILLSQTDWSTNHGRMLVDILSAAITADPPDEDRAVALARVLRAEPRARAQALAIANEKKYRNEGRKSVARAAEEALQPR